MIFFPGEQLDGVRSGAITLTFRVWDRARVKAGSLQRSHPIGVIAIDSVDAVPLSSATDKDARRAGHANRAALAASLAARAGAPLAPGDIVWKIAFRYVGDADHAANALDADVTDADLAAIEKALADFDARSDVGPWTAKTLALIAASPKTAASELARSVGRDTPSFKADVVKLKRLGLTESFSVGYGISPRGEMYMKLEARKPATSRAQRPRAARSRVSRKSGSKTPSTRTE